MEALIRKIREYLQEKNRAKKFRQTLLGIAVVVVFITTYALILPAITLDQDTAAADPAVVLEENQPEEPEMAAADTDNTASDTANTDTNNTETEMEVPVESTAEAETEAPAETPVEPETEARAEVIDTPAETPDAKDASQETMTDTEAVSEEPQAGEQVFNGHDFTLTVKYDENAGLTASADLEVTELLDAERNDPEDYDYVNKEYYKGYKDGTLFAVRKNVDESAELSDIRFFHINFMQEGKAVTPEGTVHVTLEYKKPVEVDSNVIIKAVHFDDSKEEPVVLPVEVTGQKGKDGGKNTIEKLSFDTARLSFYAITYASSNSETAITNETAAAADIETAQEPQDGDTVETDTPADRTVQSEDEQLSDDPDAENEQTVFFMDDEASAAEETSPAADAVSEENPSDEANMPAAKFVDLATNVIVNVEAEEGTFPEGTTMEVTPADAVKVEAAAEEVVSGKIQKVEAVDITFRNAEGEEIQPARPIRVTMLPKAIKSAEDATVIHVDGEGNADVVDAQTEGAKLQFEAEKFSVYAIVYTVDFHYEANGETYDFSIPGGGSINLTDLVELLGIIGDTNPDIAGNENESENESETADDAEENVAGEKTENFVADVASVEFSSPSLVDVSKADADTTVGQIKESRGLECVYSAELTEEKTEEINAQTVKAGDWVLISLQPFDTEETLTVTMKNGDQFMVRVTDAAIQYPGTTTIHYGYVGEDGVFVEFPDSMKPSANITGLDTSFGWHYLIYDFYGEDSNGKAFQWNYSGTYYSASGSAATPVRTGTPIQPALRYYNKSWRYFDQMRYTNTTITNNSNWKTVNNHSDIYVVYEQPTITDGGSPTLKINAQMPDAPDILKQSVENGDGTNTLSLSITGSTAPMEVEKLADVIVILDLSSSMRKSIGSETAHSNYTTNTDSRYYQAKLAVQNLANKLYQRNAKAGTDLYRMGLVTFSNDAQVRQTLTSSQATFQSALDGITEYESNGTNWEYALQLANSMSVDSGRATYIVFVTDGDPTWRQTRWELKDTQLSGDASVENGDLYYGGMSGGNFRDRWHGNGEDQYLKFRDYFGSATFGGLWTPHFDSWDWRNQHGCYDEVQSMVDHNKNFYAIGISNAVSVSSLDGLVRQAGLSSDHSTVETTGDGLARAFETVLAAMDGKTGQADIEMFDGITDLTQTISKVNQEENRLIGADGNFTYWKSSKPEGWDNWTKDEKTAYTAGMNYVGSNERPDGFASWTAAEKAAFAKGQRVTFTEWTSRAADGCAEAVYDTETGAVKWNMGDKFMLEDGVTYKVSFICWPSQEAYDIIAKLNNGTISFGDPEVCSQDVWDQFEGDAASGYTLRTNAEGAHTRYSTATNVNGTVTVGAEQDPLPFQHVPPMPLDKDKLNVAKIWQASKIDTQDPESVVLQVVGDDELYKEFEITPTETTDGSDTPNKGRSENIFISCGHLKVNKSTGAVVIYESGHDFSLREVEENSRHWDLDAATCRPMKNNTHETMLILVEDNAVPAGMTGNTSYYASGSDEYYRIDGKVYKDTHSWADITGMNTRRSFLDLSKEVLTDNVVWTETADTKFTYKIKIDVDPVTMSWDPDLEKYIVISVRGDGYTPADAIADTTFPTTAKLPSQSGMPSDLIHEGYDSRYLVAESGVEFYLSIRNGWSVRFLNLPAGTSYSIEEVLPENSEYDFNNVRLETRKDSSSAAPETSNTYHTIKLEGDITETSTLYKVVYQNDAKTKKVRILKTGQDGTTPLRGAKFDLYTESAYTSDPKGTPMKENLISSDQSTSMGQIDLGRLPVGKYYLVETKAPEGYIMRTEPVVITVSKSSVTYDDGTALSQSGSGISQIGDVYQLTVTNDAGITLPNTGGTGTRVFYLFGSVLILGAGALLCGKRRLI